MDSEEYKYLRDWANKYELAAIAMKSHGAIAGVHPLIHQILVDVLQSENEKIRAKLLISDGFYATALTGGGHTPLPGKAQ